MVWRPVAIPQSQNTQSFSIFSVYLSLDKIHTCKVHVHTHTHIWRHRAWVHTSSIARNLNTISKNEARARARTCWCRVTVSVFYVSFVLWRQRVAECPGQLCVNKTNTNWIHRLQQLQLRAWKHNRPYSCNSLSLNRKSLGFRMEKRMEFWLI